ncbi:oxygenase MpaB family protein [Cryptosporangium minutisporangium]|uniref:oxygenase MpaB family protein n=1 Tax=Cryptosporangium minutisporangium TaxID=113569 RepID=UPI0031EBCB6E
MPRNTLTARIQRLDPESDHAEIVRLLFFHEFPWDLRTAGKLVIWHLYAVPGTAARIGPTDALAGRSHTTSLAFGDLVAEGFDSPSGRTVLRGINRGHRSGRVSTEDNRYALAALAVTAVRWLDRYGWRPLAPAERTAIAVFHAELGRRMGVPDLPRTYPAQAEYLAACERTRFAPSEAGRVASERTLAMVRAHAPWPIRPLVVPVFATLLSPGVRAAVGLPDAPAPVRWAVRSALAARRRVVRLLPPRPRPTTPRTRRNLPPATAEADAGRVDLARPG